MTNETAIRGLYHKVFTSKDKTVVTMVLRVNTDRERVQTGCGKWISYSKFVNDFTVE